MMKRILYIFIAAALLSSCGSDKTTTTPPVDQALETFLAKTTEGAYVSGANTIMFDEAVHQVAKNPTALTYRIQNDAQTLFFQAKLSAKPATEKQEVTVTVNSRGVTGLSTSYVMTLEKSSGDKLWLWNDSSDTGIIVAL